MRTTVNRARRSESGFTLIELLIVIVILGILAAIVVFSVQGITDKGKTSACKTSVATIDTAAEAYVANSTASPLPVATNLKLSDLTPNFLHSIPSTVGGTSVDGTTLVSAVDLIGC